MQCTRCKEEFKFESQLKRHMERKNPCKVVDNGIKCSFCMKPWDTERQMKQRDRGTKEAKQKERERTAKDRDQKDRRREERQTLQKGKRRDLDLSKIFVPSLFV